MRVRGSDQLKTVLARTRYRTKQFTTELPEIENHAEEILDQKVRARNFEARNERTATMTLAKSKSKGKSASKGRKGNAANGEQKESARKETHAVSATTRATVENQRARPPLSQNRRRKAKGNILRKEGSPEAAVHLEKGFRDRARITLLEIVRTPRVLLSSRMSE